MGADGYTPVFGSVFDGTLCGKWPDSAVWLTMLALCDKRGNVDMTYQAIVGRTGWPLDLLRQGIAALMQPDSESRSPAEAGRRLVPLDSARGWGWHVVNHGLYREKARLQAQGSAQVADGRNAEKVRRYKERHRQTPEDTTGPPETPGGTLSDSNTNSDSNTKKKPSLRSGRARRCPADFEITEAMREWASKEVPEVDVEAQTKLFRDHEYRDAKSDWPAAWRTWMKRSIDYQLRSSGSRGRPPESLKLRTADEIEAEERARAQHRTP